MVPPTLHDYHMRGIEPWRLIEPPRQYTFGLTEHDDPSYRGLSGNSHLAPPVVNTHLASYEVNTHLRGQYPMESLLQAAERRTKEIVREMVEGAERDREKNRETHDAIERALAVRRNANETVYQGAGNSHFSYVKDLGWHVTTEVPGLRQGQRIAIHDSVFD